VRGQGRYADDVNLPGRAYVAIVRSRHAHGVLKGIDTAAALRMPAALATRGAAPGGLIADRILHDRQLCNFIARTVMDIGFDGESASTAACLDPSVLCWTTGFVCFAFDRLLAADRGFTLARALLLDIFVGSSLGSPRTIALHYRNPAEAGRRWRGRGACPTRIGPP
jgi:hypothetical protein